MQVNRERVHDDDFLVTGADQRGDSGGDGDLDVGPREGVCKVCGDGEGGPFVEMRLYGETSGEWLRTERVAAQVDGGWEGEEGTG